MLGRQPALGLAELESVFGAENVFRSASEVARLNVPAHKIAGTPLGGVMKVGQVLADLPLDSLDVLFEALPAILADELTAMPDAGKLRLGISLHGFRPPLERLQQYGLSLKRKISGQYARNVRLVPNKELVLNSAQVTHNQLTKKTGIELLLVRSGESAIVARTVGVQNINDYASRDQARPARDAKTGMLPPKLAQIMINLAVGGQSWHTDAPLLDPFCGSGVLLQEATLMGLNVYGTDVDKRMIDFCRQNLDWLRRQRNLAFNARLEVADARTASWQKPIGAVASETYLGPPLTNSPDPARLAKIANEVNSLIKDFLTNLAAQLDSGQRICLAVPAWKRQADFLHLSFIDEVEDLGYNLLSFVHATRQELVYHRPQQQVARQLLVIIRK